LFLSQRSRHEGWLSNHDRFTHQEQKNFYKRSDYIKEREFFELFQNSGFGTFVLKQGDNVLTVIYE